MSESEKRKFSKEEIIEALRKANIEIEPPKEDNKLDVPYICDKVILEIQEGKYKYSNSAISHFFHEIGIADQEILNCNYRKDFKELFSKEINIKIQENDQNNNFFKKMSKRVKDIWDSPNTSNIPLECREKLDLPKTFEDASKLYQEIHDDKIEVFEENCDVRMENNVYFTNRFGKSTGVAITKSDGIWIAPPIQVNRDFFIVVPSGSPDPVIWGCFSEEGKYYLCADSDDVKIDASNKNTNYKIIFANEEFTRFFSKNIKISSKQLPDVDEVLCIDFGSSNTTAGTWIRTENGVEPELVNFDNLITGEESKFLPTIVYLKDLQNKKDQFLFGYKAKKRIIEEDYNPEGKIFYNIKQWIASNDDFKIKTGTDEKGNECEKYELFAKDIIIEYIKYVIINAETKLKHKFRRLHFSAPVKCKELFITFLTEKFQQWKDEYEILPAKESLDEAVAIIYKRISEFRAEFENGRREPNGELMVIDCGGGTTDAASCSYLFTKTDTGTKIDITTKFENGQTAFGGNDLTYRIFQFLKIRLRDYYCKKSIKNTTTTIFNNLEKFHKIDMATGQILNNAEEDFFSHIDTCIKLKRRFDCYDQLDTESKLAEWIIPTDFDNKEIIGDGTKIPKYAHHNFNYLWQLAEQWKSDLYSEDATFDINFEKLKTSHPNLGNIGFYVNTTAIKNTAEQNNETDQEEIKKEIKDKNFEIIKEDPNIFLNREELITLLKPQIYYLLSVMFLKPDGTERANNELPKKLHLSGQSCKIGTFQDMLKEFIPGKHLRGGTKLETAEQKKLACVEGCIQYLSDKAYGKVSAKIECDMPNIIYTVVVDKDNISSKTLLDGGKIYRQGNKTYMPEIVIHKRESSIGNIQLDILNNLIKDDKWNTSIKIKADFFEGYDVKDSKELKEVIKQKSPADFEQWEIAGKEEKTLVLDRLIENLNQDEAINKLFIFAIPNNDGFTFTLWQILKYNHGKGDIFRIMGSDNIQYQEIEFTTRFDGKNCK